MKIGFYTQNFDAPSSYLHKKCFFEGSLNIEKFNQKKINEYDWIFIMSYEKDLELLNKIQKNRKIKIALIDPRLPIKSAFAKQVDLIIVDSIEMEDYFLKYNIPVFRYLAYPNFKVNTLVNKSKHEINLGYHGNLDHLNEMSEFIVNAIEKLGIDFSVNFNLLYNFKKKKFNKIIKNVKINHIQWSDINFKFFLKNCDIGIVPNLKVNLFNKLNEKNNPINYSLKFKLSSGPGRIMPFAINSIPVVCDMYPSAVSFIDNNIDGFVCYSKDAWYSSLKKLSKSIKLRNQIGFSLNKKLFPKLSMLNQNNKLNEFIKKI